MKTKLLLIISLLLAPIALLRAAELKTATVYSDHMVLQRGKTLPVWGCHLQ
jgi:hypothetical protein